MRGHPGKTVLLLVLPFLLETAEDAYSQFKVRPEFECLGVSSIDPFIPKPGFEPQSDGVWWSPAATPTGGSSNSPAWVSVAGGIGGGAVLGTAGTVVGYLLEKNVFDPECVDDGEICSCWCTGAGFGLIGGESLGLAIGVHLGNRRRGNFGLDLLTSAGGMAVGFGTASLLDNNDAKQTVFVLGTPILQLASTTYVEHRTGR